MKKIIYILVCCFSINTVLLWGESVNIQIDTAISYQIITGWEATSFIMSECNPNFNRMRDALLPYLVDSIGITRVRLEVRSGTEHTFDNYQTFLDYGCPKSPDTNYQKWRAIRYATVNDNDNPRLINWAGFHFTELDLKIENVIIPLKKLLEERGTKLFINLCYVAFTGQIKDGEYIHNDPNEYAEFVLATYLHIQDKYGFVPDTWEILLEPDNVKEWDGTLIGQAIVKSAERLKEYGFVPHFVAPSTTNMANAISYFDEMIKIPYAIDYIEEISYHRYGGVSQTNLKEIAKRAEQYNKNTSMLEWWFDNATHKVLYEDLAIGNNSAFQQSTINGFFNVDTSNWEKLKITIKDVTQYNRLYYLFIRPGAVRKNATTNNSFVKPLAFVNKDSSFTLILDSDDSSNVSISGLPTGEYAVKYTSETGKFADATEIIVQNDGKASIQIPKGVVALYSKSKALPVIEESSSNVEFKISPNPASDYIEIYPPLEGSERGRTEIKIYNTLGECVINVGANHYLPLQRIDISHLPVGVYFVKIGINTATFAKIK